jgi:uncharacterized membrane protein
MAWLAIIALAIWVFVERQRVSALARELSELRQRLGASTPAFRRPPPSGITPAMETAARVAADVAFERAVATPVSPLMPEPTTVVAPPSPPAGPQPPVVPAPPPPPREPLFTRASLEKWLAERGLAWIGGSALVIGGGFLVGYAAQQGFFNPAMRIIAAVVLGFALLGAGEAIRRGRLAGFGGHKLAAAVASGAGASVLYGATWAADHLYDFIGGGACSGLLAVIAWGLLGLAFLHGEALAVLALGGAFAAPLLAGADLWAFEALSLYLGILIAAGSAIAWLRRWTLAAWTNLVVAAIWSTLAAVQQDALKCLLVGLGPLAATAALAYLAPRTPRRTIGPGVAIVASLAAYIAVAVADAQHRSVLIGVIAGLALPAFTAALQRKGQVPAWSLAVPGAAFTLAAIAARLAGYHSPTQTAVWCLQVLALDAATLWATWRDERRAASGAGALSSLALALVAGAGLGSAAQAAIGPAVACLALALGALRLATDRRRPADQRALEIWGGGAAAALLATVALGLPWRWAAIGFALASLLLALFARRLKWRAIAIAAASGAGLGLAALLNPSIVTQALHGGADAWFLLGAGLVVAVAAFVGARLVAYDTGAAEALRTLSPLAALAAAFVFLRWVAGGPGGLALDGLTEASIRTFLIADAGLAGLAQIGSATSAFARWRGHLLLFAAAAHGLVFQVLLFNPRFGLFGDLAGGPPLLNSLAAAYLVPALLFAAAAWRSYRVQRGPARIYAVIALASVVLWALLEIRRFTHGPHLGGGLTTIGAGEAVACSLLLLGVALVADRLRPRGETPAHPVRGDIARILTLLRGLAVGFAVVMAGFWSNPCWGAAAAPFDGSLVLVAVLAGYGLIVLATARLALDARAAAKPVEADVQVLAAMLFGLILASLSVRVVFHGADLTLRQGAGQLETWSYSAVWAVVGLGFIGVSRLGGRIFLRAGLALLMITTLKVFVIDTASLSGVIRAGSFLALGMLLLLGALTARRLAQSAGQPGRAADAETG